MHKLICSVQTYDWGKPGSRSTVAALVKDGHHANYVDEDKPYAEVRFRSLQGFIWWEKHLSVAESSTKQEAVMLHAKDPYIYPDPNHKPEMAIALTNFELLCGFRPPLEIYENLRACPEILELVGNCDDLKKLLDSNEAVARQMLKHVFTKIWSSPPEAIAKAVQAFVTRISKDPKGDLHELIIRLDKAYPGGDVGVFAPLLLNYFTLKPGQATFLGPNQPHAYLSGDCIECMACSDNTIRAGLTPKFKDIGTLCANLTYVMSGPPIFPHKEVAPGVTLYAPPVPEFAVQAVGVGRRPRSSLRESASSIVVVISGKAHFKGGQRILKFTAVTSFSSQQPVAMFRL
ncbi:phosphomannose isomerase type I [Ostertagia ostertagi]